MKYKVTQADDGYFLITDKDGILAFDAPSGIKASVEPVAAAMNRAYEAGRQSAELAKKEAKP